MAAKSGRNSLNRDTLKQNKITFREDPAETAKDPRGPHIRRLRDILLDFDCTSPSTLEILPNDQDAHLLDTTQSLKERFRALGFSWWERHTIRESIESYRSARQQALKLHNGKDREAEWTKFFSNRFFDPLEQDMEIKTQDLRRISRIKFYYEYFEQAQDRPWPLFGPKYNFCAEYRQGLTQPKPDRAFYFPIYDFNAQSAERICTPEVWGWDKSPKESIIENFSSTVLRHLSGRDKLEPSTAGIFREENTGKAALSDGISFPWLIVEHKKSENMEEYCHCQAANAGAAAVMMLRRLSTYARATYHQSHVPPVVTMTTVDKIVRVWVVQSISAPHGEPPIQMDCIWKGDMTHVRDLMYLTAILENLHTWAMRVLRPWISGYIDLWLAEFPLTTGITLAADEQAPEKSVSRKTKKRPSSSIPAVPAKSRSAGKTVHHHHDVDDEHGAGVPDSKSDQTSTASSRPTADEDYPEEYETPLTPPMIVDSQPERKAKPKLPRKPGQQKLERYRNAEHAYYEAADTQSNAGEEGEEEEEGNGTLLAGHLAGMGLEEKAPGALDPLNDDEPIPGTVRRKSTLRQKMIEGLSLVKSKKKKKWKVSNIVNT